MPIIKYPVIYLIRGIKRGYLGESIAFYIGKVLYNIDSRMEEHRNNKRSQFEREYTYADYEIIEEIGNSNYDAVNIEKLTNILELYHTLKCLCANTKIKVFGGPFCNDTYYKRTKIIPFCKIIGLVNANNLVCNVKKFIFICNQFKPFIKNINSLIFIKEEGTLSKKFYSQIFKKIRNHIFGKTFERITKDELKCVRLIPGIYENIQTGDTAGAKNEELTNKKAFDILYDKIRILRNQLEERDKVIEVLTEVNQELIDKNEKIKIKKLPNFYPRRSRRLRNMTPE